MIEREETIQVLESIKRKLNMKTVINTEMVATWHSFLKKHETGIIKKAIERIAIEWDQNSFPKAKHFRDYLALAENEAIADKAPFEIGPDDVSDMSARVRRLLGTSERNIDRRARDKDKSREPCVKCDKPALMNMTADDYFIYWGMDTPEKFKGTRRCGPCTDRMNKELFKSVKVRRG